MIVVAELRDMTPALKAEIEDSLVAILRTEILAQLADASAPSGSPCSSDSDSLLRAETGHALPEVLTR